jgi:hypothetical protein
MAYNTLLLLVVMIIGSTQVLKPASNAPIIAYNFARPNGVLVSQTRGPGAQLVNEIAWHEEVSGVV